MTSTIADVESTHMTLFLALLQKDSIELRVRILFPRWPLAELNVPSSIFGK